MKVLKPEIDKINEKHKGKDPMKLQQATMNFYRKAGVNPMGGCLPMLFQFPILIAMFRFFPASIELRQQSFLWADDLSAYDSIYELGFSIPFYGDHVSLFTLLMTISTLLYTRMNSSMATGQMAQMKWMMYLMPIMFLGFFNNYAAGLSYYYFLANMFTFGQQAIMKTTIDENKLLAQIEENKKKPKRNLIFKKIRRTSKKQERRLKNRKITVKFYFILIFIFVSCNTIKDINIKEPLISLQRTACFGECPIYKFEIYSSGDCIYYGKKFVEKIGQYKFQLKKETILI